MPLNRGCAKALVIAVLLLGLLAPAASQARPAYEAFGSCGGGKPFAAATRCAFDRPGHARATIVFRSNVGARALKVCQKIYGLSFHGRQCLKAKQPTAHEAIPFTLSDAADDFKLVVTFYAKEPGAGDGAYEQAARVTLRFDG